MIAKAGTLFGTLFWLFGLILGCYTFIMVLLILIGSNSPTDHATGAGTGALASPALFVSSAVAKAPQAPFIEALSQLSDNLAFIFIATAISIVSLLIGYGLAFRNHPKRDRARA
jgi:hypothetical protein